MDLTLATTVVGLLAPFVSKGAEEFVKDAGKDAYEKSKHLFSYLKGKLAGSKEGAGTLSSFEEKPERYEGVLRQVLEDEIKADPAFAAELSRRVSEFGPRVEVRQKIETARDNTGLEANEIRRGSVSLDQDIKDAEHNVGVKVDKIG